MAVTAHIYPYAIDQIGKKAINLTSDTFKALLMTGSAATWGATQEAYQFVSTVIAAYTEVTGGGYARVTLASPTYTFSGNVNTWSCASPISFGASVTISAASMLIFDSSIGGGVDSATPVVSIIDFGGTVSSTAGAWTYTVSGSGLATWTES